MHRKFKDEIIYPFSNFHPTLYDVCYYLVMLESKLILIRKRWSWGKAILG